MQNPGSFGGVGAFGTFHDSDRCPVCHVPERAPHLSSCSYTGLCAVTAAVTGQIGAGHAAPADPNEDDWDDD